MIKKIIKLNYPAGYFTLLLTAGVLFLLFLTFALLEYTSTKKNFVSILEENGFTLLDALTAGGAQSVLAYEEFELLIQSRMFDNAHWIEEIDYQEGMSQEILGKAAAKIGRNSVLLFDRSGRRVFSSGQAPGAASEIVPAFRQMLDEFLADESRDSLAAGFSQGTSPLRQHYAVIIRRRKGGAVALAADAAGLIELRRELGPGRLVREISSQPGIAYVVLQDTLGILMAGESVTAMNSIPADPFLLDVYTARSRDARFFHWQNTGVFEIAGDFQIGDVNAGIFRIGLDISHYTHIMKRTRYRLAFIVLLYVLGGAAGISVLMSRQNLRTLSVAYKRVQTHTGEILQKMQDGVIAADSSGRISVFNEAAAGILGVSAGGAAGMDISALDRSVFEVIDESLHTGLPVEPRLVRTVINGRKTALSLRTSILPADDGSIDTVILVLSDLTEQERLEEALRRKEKHTAMGKLAAGVAHEIRNPINAISMIAQRLVSEFKPEKGREEYVSLTQAMIAESRRSDEIIRRFLAFARPPELNRAAVSSVSLLREAVSIMQSSAEAEHVTLRAASVEDTDLYLDRDQMKQVLLNLIRNSLQASSARGEIIITGQKTSDTYIIKVGDTGSGIPEEYLDAVFDLYFTTRKDGLGMGLAIVYQIITRHGGTVSISNKKTAGTECTIQLPIEGV